MVNLCVKLKGNPQIIRVEADTVEDESGNSEIFAKKDGNIVGRFRRNGVVGWWVEPFVPSPKDRLNEVVEALRQSPSADRNHR